MEYARSIRMSNETEALIPLFIGQLSDPTGARLIAIDGVGGGVIHEVSVALTRQLGKVVSELGSATTRQVTISSS